MTAASGFFGKLPGRGDFVQRRLSNEFVAPWDAWLRQGLASSQAELGADWSNLYLNGPIWRFALAPGLCGPEAIIGVLMPSVDSVSRLFPLTLALAVGDAPPAIAALEAGAWFAAAEALALDVLRDNFDFEAWDARVTALAQPLFADGSLDMACGDAPPRLPIPGANALSNAYPRLLAALLRSRAAHHSLWWTDGSDAVAPVFQAAIEPSLPAVFSDLLRDPNDHPRPADRRAAPGL